MSSMSQKLELFAAPTLTCGDCIIYYDMIYLSIAIGLSPGDSSTVYIYTQTIHRTTQIQTIRRTTQITTGQHK